MMVYNTAILVLLYIEDVAVDDLLYLTYTAHIKCWLRARQGLPILTLRFSSAAVL
jgi:hypothetical protein